MPPAYRKMSEYDKCEMTITMNFEIPFSFLMYLRFFSWIGGYKKLIYSKWVMYNDLFQQRGQNLTSMWFVKTKQTLMKNIYMISNKQTSFNKHKVTSQAELAWNLHKWYQNQISVTQTIIERRTIKNVHIYKPLKQTHTF